MSDADQAIALILEALRSLEGALERLKVKPKMHAEVSARCLELQSSIATARKLISFNCDSLHGCLYRLEEDF